MKNRLGFLELYSSDQHVACAECFALIFAGCLGEHILKKRKKNLGRQSYQYFLVANPAMVGPMIIATAISAAALGMSALMRNTPAAQLAITSATTARIMAMIMPMMLITRSFVAASALFSTI